MSHSLNSEKELYKRSSKDNEVCVSYYVESNLIGECHGNKRAVHVYNCFMTSRTSLP